MAIRFCFLCYKGINSLGNHLRWEHPTVSLQNYYDKFFKKENEGFCQNEKCNNETQFNSSKWHYNTYCCNKCMKTSDVYKQRCAVGVKQVWKLRTNEKRKEIGQKILKTNMKDPNYLNNCRDNIRKIYKNKTEQELKEIQDKRLKSLKETWKNRTDEDNMDMQHKTQITKKEKWGDATYNNREQAKKTMKEKYGYDFWMQCPENGKLYSDRFKNYTDEDWRAFKENVSNGLLNRTQQEKKDWQKLRLETISKYTDKQKEKIRNKKKTTWYKKSQYELHQIQQKRAKNSKHKYEYKQLSFHSFDEMCYYIYIKENTNYKIVRNEMNFYLPYYYDGKMLSYYPDFKVDNKIIEIKGLQFFENKNPNGKFINPYDRNQDAKYEAKYKCMIDNNVEIITDTKQYTDYVINKYGRKLRID